MTDPTTIATEALELAEKATKGPWRAFCGKSNTLVTRDRQGPGDETGSVQICHIAGADDEDLRPFNRDRWEADAKLIAFSREALPTLARALLSREAEVERLTKENERPIPMLLYCPTCGAQHIDGPET